MVYEGMYRYILWPLFPVWGGVSPGKLKVPPFDLHAWGGVGTPLLICYSVVNYHMFLNTSHGQLCVQDNNLKINKKVRKLTQVTSPMGFLVFPLSHPSVRVTQLHAMAH